MTSLSTPYIFLGFQFPETGHFGGIFVPEDALRPCCELFLLKLADNIRQAGYVLDLLRFKYHEKFLTFKKSQELAKELENRNAGLTARPSAYKAWIFKEDNDLSKILKHEYTPGTRKWDFGRLSLTWGIPLASAGTLQNSLCGEYIACAGQKICFDYPEGKKRQWFFDLLNRNKKMNFSVYSTAKPEILRELAGTGQKPSEYTRTKWNEEIEKQAYTLITNGEIRLDAEHLNNGGLPAMIMLAALQCEADRRIKAEKPGYDPLTQADQTEITLDTFSVTDAFFRENVRYQTVKIKHLGSEYVLKAQIVKDLIDTAELTFKGQKIRNAPEQTAAREISVQRGI